VISARTGDEWLVRAHNQAQAIRHVVRGEYRAAVAGQETLIELLLAGVKVQDANDKPQLEIDEPDETLSPEDRPLPVAVPIDDGHDGSEP